MRDKFHWRLELAYAIIYWSFTYSFLFLGLILSLEKAHLNWRSLVAFVVFFSLIGIDRRRFIQFTDNQMMLSYGNYWKKQAITYQACEKVEVFVDALLIHHQTKKTLLYFSEKEKEKMLLCLEKTYPGKIIYHANKYDQS